ncbi:MAG TPA: TIGR03084 family protein [Acidimicrobiaceae bacterium]|jgi:uncharacterized protein (TIGR03084 family)|nr:TIGR03084 family protein [Acidimicrobiaceae bacterium]
MSDLLNQLRSDLAAEHSALDRVVADLQEHEFSTPTPATGWDIQDQLGHLGGFDEAGTQAILDPEAFNATLVRLIETGGDPVADYTALTRSRTGPETLQWWREARSSFIAATEGCAPSLRIPWYGPPMGIISHLTARLMETWAHGQDIRDALGVEPEVSARLRHIADLGIRARPFTYSLHGLPAPVEPIAVILQAPDGSEWTWGEPGGVNEVRGTALDFVMLATQRRNLADCAVTATGAVAEQWCSIIQAFAGGIGGGRPPLSTKS